MTFENDWCDICTIVAYYDYLTITILDLKLISPENIIKINMHYYMPFTGVF